MLSPETATAPGSYWLNSSSEQVAQRRLFFAPGVGQFSRQAADNRVVFAVHDFFERVNELLKFLVRLGQVLVYRDELPLPLDDAVGIVVHHDIKSPDLVGTHTRLGDAESQVTETITGGPACR